MNTDGTAASAAEITARSWCSAAEHGDTTAAATGPLAALTKLGEQRLVPLADPSRRASGR